MADISDGAIVGSAIIKIIDEYGEASPKHVGEYVKACLLYTSQHKARIVAA